MSHGFKNGRTRDWERRTMAGAYLVDRPRCWFMFWCCSCWWYCLKTISAVVNPLIHVCLAHTYVPCPRKEAATKRKLPPSCRRRHICLSLRWLWCINNYVYSPGVLKVRPTSSTYPVLGSGGIPMENGTIFALPLPLKLLRFYNSTKGNYSNCQPWQLASNQFWLVIPSVARISIIRGIKIPVQR